MRRDKYQRIAYAIRRLSIAVDRVMLAKSEKEKQQALSWAKAWGARGRFAPFNLFNCVIDANETLQTNSQTESLSHAKVVKFKKSLVV